MSNTANREMTDEKAEMIVAVASIAVLVVTMTVGTIAMIRIDRKDYTPKKK